MIIFRGKEVTDIMKKSGSQIIIETLIEQGVTDVFGYPGGQVINIYDEIYNYRDRINHFLTAHEQGAAHAADGYARVTGKVGVVIATSGPGATNLVTGIATAYLDSVPLVAITGNVSCPLIGKDSFQEIDITGITLPITKHNYFVNRIEDLADVIREAFRIAKSGRPGPVLIDIPKDIQMAVCEYTRKTPEPLFDEGIASDEAIAAAADIINSSKRPYVYIGGGVIRAGVSEQVKLLAEKADAYIGSSLMGLSAIETDYDRFLGMQGMHGHYASSMALYNSDAIIAIGARFSDRATGNKNKYAPGAKIIHIDVDFAEINKNVKAEVGILGKLENSLLRLTASINEKHNSEWSKLIEKLRVEENSFSKKSTVFSPKDIIDVINNNIEKDTVVATDVGQHQMWAAQYLNFKASRTFVSSGGLGTMGFGMGAAMGAAVGRKKPVVLITGDGSFGMNLNELAAAVRYDVPIIIVMMNNTVLGMVRQWQSLFFNKQYSNTTLNRKTDFVKLAEAFGAKGFRTETKSEFEGVFREAFKNCIGPCFIECPVDKDEFVLPMLPPGGSVEEMICEIGEF